jgi:delta 1-pyrroline-5-carboxylate dehydrogenase
MQEEIFGPVLVAMTFRTPEEAVALANNTKYGLAATVWTENINLALDVAPKLKAGVVWVNATNLFDAAAGFGGVRESGFGREGGWEGLMAYLKPAAKPGPETRHRHPGPARAASRRPRPHRQDVHRRQTGPPRRRLLAARSTAQRQSSSAMSASAAARTSATR